MFDEWLPCDPEGLPSLRLPKTAALVLQNHIYKLITGFSRLQGVVNKSFKEKELKRLERENPQIDKAVFQQYLDSPEVTSPGRDD